ncbi:MAG TPA: M28 family peptidase [Casimicrobiaceae bacterium]|nr:M28 family peptidase [Casimicrobiaceae bacterium]
MSNPPVVDEVSAENVRRYVEHVCENIPSRLAGSENALRMARYNADALRAIGVAGEVQELQALVSFPRAGKVHVHAPRPIAVEAFTSGHSLVTPPGGLRGELVYVGSGAARDYAGKDVRGKIVLCEISYSPARMEKQRIAAQRGAVGAVMMNWGHPTDTALPFGSIKPAWGNPTPQTWREEMPQMPSVGVSRHSGTLLRGLCDAGRVELTMETDVDNAWRPVQITVGDIEAPDSDDFIIVGGHQDSWYGPAATDNAAGNGCIIELARVFNARRNELRRGVSLGFWTAHETGTMAGSTWYVDRNWDRLRAHAIAYLLIDQPACTGTTRWLTTSNLEMRRFHQAIERRYLDVPSDWKPQKKGGDASFFGLGVPMLYGMGAFTEAELHATADANLGWWHHSLECTIDKVDFAWMQPHLRVYAAWLWDLCTAPILPFEFTAVAQQFAARLDELSKLDADNALQLSDVAERARDLHRRASALDAHVSAWRQRYRESEPDARRAATVLNACLKRLSNLLIPIQSTVKGVYGHDPYGFTPQLTAIPCLYDVTALAGITDGADRVMLQTHLVRERNRVADAVDAACGTIDMAWTQLGT